jgi:hypothetical protein
LCRDKQVPADEKTCLQKHKDQFGKGNFDAKEDNKLDAKKTCKENLEDDNTWCLKGYYPRTWPYTAFRNELRAMQDCCAQTCGYCHSNQRG